MSRFDILVVMRIGTPAGGRHLQGPLTSGSRRSLNLGYHCQVLIYNVSAAFVILHDFNKSQKQNVTIIS